MKHEKYPQGKIMHLPVEVVEYDSAGNPRVTYTICLNEPTINKVYPLSSDLLEPPVEASDAEVEEVAEKLGMINGLSCEECSLIGRIVSIARRPRATETQELAKLATKVLEQRSEIAGLESDVQSLIKDLGEAQVAKTEQAFEEGETVIFKGEEYLVIEPHPRIQLNIKTERICAQDIYPYIFNVTKLPPAPQTITYDGNEIKLSQLSESARKEIQGL